QADVQAGNEEFALQAPPGTARLDWNCLADSVAVHRLEKLPETIKPNTPEEQKKFQELCTSVRQLHSGAIDKVLEKFLTSANPMERKGGVVILGALDKLPRLMEALNDPKHVDVREQSIIVLRSWIGRAGGQAEKFYKVLTDSKKLTPVQARNALHLLYGFDD